MTLATFAALMLLTAAPPCPEVQDAQAACCPNDRQCIAAHEREEARQRYTERLHTELSFGYLGEYRNDSGRSFELDGSEATPGTGGLNAPFTGAPFNGYAASGIAVESRVVYDRLRFTLGLRFPFASYRVGDTAQTVDFAGATHDLSVKSVSLFGFRTGIGFELPYGMVTPFVDVLGDVEKVSTTLVIDGEPVKYTAAGFSLGARTGMRIQISQVFLALSGEASVLGAWRFGGSLQAGVAF
jgi:hypothetical protein